MDESRRSDFEKLGEIMKGKSFEIDEKASFLRSYLYKYGVIYGADEIVKLAENLKSGEERASLYRILFSKEAVEEWKASCGTGDSAACYFSGFVSKGSVRKYFFGEACRGGVGVACLEMASLLENEEKWREHTEYSKKACSYGFPGACFTAGNIYYKGKYDGSIDMENALKYLDKACQKDISIGCAYLGWIFEHGESVRKDRKRAASYYEKSCSLGYLKACEMKANLK